MGFMAPRRVEFRDEWTEARLTGLADYKFVPNLAPESNPLEQRHLRSPWMMAKLADAVVSEAALGLHKSEVVDGWIYPDDAKHPQRISMEELIEKVAPGALDTVCCVTSAYPHVGGLARLI